MMVVVVVVMMVMMVVVMMIVVIYKMEKSFTSTLSTLTPHGSVASSRVT